MRGRGRQRMETERSRNKMLEAMRKSINELEKYRFVELRPSLRAEWRDLLVYRLPGLQRFLDVSRTALLHQGQEETDILQVVRKLWSGLATDPETDDVDGQTWEEE